MFGFKIKTVNGLKLTQLVHLDIWKIEKADWKLTHNSHKLDKVQLLHQLLLLQEEKLSKQTKDSFQLMEKTLPKSKTGLLLRFIGKNIKISHIKGHKHTTIIKGLTEERMGFVYDPSTQTYELNVVSEDTSKGLFVDPQNPAKYQLSKEKSKFDAYVEFKMLRNEHGTPEQRKKAMECCHLLGSEIKVHQCMHDFIKTGKCFVHEFSNHQPDLIFRK